MKIVDCFCGLGPWATRNPILPSRADEILELMDHTGVTEALVYHNMPKFGGRSADVNRQIAELCSDEPRFIPAFVIGLDTYHESQTLGDFMQGMKSSGAKAVWLKLPFTPYRLVRSYQDWLIGDWMRICSEKRIPVFFHAEDESPDVINTLCTEYPELRLVLTGVMYNADAHLYPLLKRHRQLRVCTGHVYIPSGNPGRFLQHFPAERLLFGSGLPEFSPGGMIAHVQYADIPGEDKARILGGNIMELMAEVRL
jgi:predicted TIM-barrel fold metal-dependent hydrolase